LQLQLACDDELMLWLRQLEPSSHWLMYWRYIADVCRYW